MAKRNIIYKSIVFVIIFLIILVYLGEIFQIVGRNNYSAKIDSQYKLEKNSIDVAIFGSSIIEYALLPLEIYHNTGLKILPMAISGENLNTTYYKIKELYKYQSPNVIIVDLYNSTEYEHYGEHLRFSLDLMKFNFNKIMAVYSTAGKLNEHMQLYFELLHYHGSWKEIGEIFQNNTNNSIYDSLICENCMNFQLTAKEGLMNNSYEENIIVEMLKNATAEYASNYIPKYAEKYIDKIIKIAEKNNSNIIFTCIPKTDNIQEVQRIEALKNKYKYNKNVQFINLECELIDTFDYSKDMFDEKHINYLGAQKVTKYFIYYLKENYEFNETNVDKEIWDNAYIKYIDELKLKFEWEIDKEHIVGNFKDVYIEYY